MPLFMKITDPAIAGNTQVRAHASEFELYSLSLGAVANAGRTSIAPITVTLAAYNAPRLLGALSSAQPFRVVFQNSVIGGKGEESPYETITLTEGRITRFQETAGTEGRPTLELAFSFGRLEFVQSGINYTYIYPPK